MNKYLIPICDIDAGSTWIEVILAKSIADCKDKIIDHLINEYDINDSYSDYNDFIERLDVNYNILVGDIQDIETI